MHGHLDQWNSDVDRKAVAAHSMMTSRHRYLEWVIQWGELESVSFGVSFHLGQFILDTLDTHLYTRELDLYILYIWYHTISIDILFFDYCLDDLGFFWNDTIPLRNNRIVQGDSMLLCVFYRIFCMGNNGHQVTKHGTTTDPTFANRRHPGALREASGPADLWNTICVHMDRQLDTQRTACSCKNPGVIGIFVSYWPMCCLEPPILRSKGLWRLRAQVQSKLFGEIFRGQSWRASREIERQIVVIGHIYLFFFRSKHFSDREVQSVIVIPLPWKVQCLYICSWNFIHQDLIFHGVSTWT